jgi:hypothetical protein
VSDEGTAERIDRACERAGAPELAPVARAVFEHAQFLLDDEANLTKVGNLAGTAKGRLARRALDLLGVEPEP